MHGLTCSIDRPGKLCYYVHTCASLQDLVLSPCSLFGG